jgi:hypothetical protein
MLASVLRHLLMVFFVHQHLKFITQNLLYFNDHGVTRYKPDCNLQGRQYFLKLHLSVVHRMLVVHCLIKLSKGLLPHTTQKPISHQEPKLQPPPSSFCYRRLLPPFAPLNHLLRASTPEIHVHKVTAPCE